MPKQFLNLTGVETLIQTTVRRISPLVPPERIFVATGERYVGLVKEQLPLLPEKNIIAEISGKNTAPAIGLGALHIAQAGRDDTMAVLTSDHIIPDEVTFRQAIQAAVEVAGEEKLVTLGITPTGPETGFGYIQRGESIGCYHGLDSYTVHAFLEKPELAMAQKFYESGAYYWNSGMFIWRVSALFEALKKHMPTLSAQLERLNEALFNPKSTGSVAEIWQQIAANSIDFGLMEKAEDVAVVPLDAGWNDVGSWAALYDELAQEPGQNVAVNANHLSFNCQGVLVQGVRRKPAFARALKGRPGHRLE
ncbi:MAG: mannose-1-phosphate guanylyltransferase, partial [Anaerolineae bacterium]